jgi:hypothetical protein
MFGLDVPLCIEVELTVLIVQLLLSPWQELVINPVLAILILAIVFPFADDVEAAPPAEVAVAPPVAAGDEAANPPPPSEILITPPPTEASVSNNSQPFHLLRVFPLPCDKACLLTTCTTPRVVFLL